MACFHACSEHHRKGDPELYRQKYNEAIRFANAMRCLATGRHLDSHAPSHPPAYGRGPLPLDGPIDLHKANGEKRRLLEFFFSSAADFLSDPLLAETKQECEAIFKRDRLWNFRDFSLFNPLIKPGILYRSATLTLVQKESFFNKMLLDTKIKTVVDLRSTREAVEKCYSADSLRLVKRIEAPIDHLAFSAGIMKIDKREADSKEVYRFFALCAAVAVRTALEGILDAEGACVVHCHSGKDRTGFLAALIHLLSGADRDMIHADFLASGMDTKTENLEVALRILAAKGGIENYLLFCGMDSGKISALKKKLAAA
ncbi:tyrosine-protein phosphatase [Algoriphagus sp. H41]|uniref:Tyrosine-protein phosphatase n=2 Tax=Algoriphagus oliviformis TaxID=2811231 RepID=A0ABS3C8G9_9BACT|nr:tyrosine-protein phosphatase [Algoriphagus oliviformis]